MDPQAEALIQRLRARPDDVDAYESLKAHYHYANDFASLSNLVEGWATRTADPQIAADGFHEAARTVSYYLSDQHRAIELLENALDRIPGHEDAAGDLARLLEALADAHADVQSLERRARRYAAADADPSAIAAIHFQIAELWEHSLERPEQAVVHYRSAFELDPEHLPAMYATREIYRRSGDLKAAAQIYELEIRAEQDSARKVMLLRELAHLHREGLSDVDASVDALDRALGHTPQDREVTYELAGALLMRAGARGDTPAGMQDRQKAADLLVRLAHGVDGETQVAFLESALDAAPDHDLALTTLEHVAASSHAEARLPLRWIRYVGMVPSGPNVANRRKRLADAYEAAGQHADAIACLEPLFSSGDLTTARRLTDLYKREGRNDDALRASSIVVASLGPAERLLALEVALESAKLGTEDADHAIRALLEADPKNAKALAARLDHARAKGDHGTVRDLLREQAENTSASASARSIAYRELAELADGPLGDHELAVKARGELVKLSPGDRDARAKLKQDMRLGERWDELAGVLVWEAANDEEASARRSAALSLDELTTRANLDPARAIEALEGVHRTARDDASVRDKLLARFITAKRSREALPLVEAKAEAAPTTNDRIALIDQAVGIRVELGDLVGAIAALERWIELDPKASEPSQRALELAERSGDPNQVARAISREADRASGDERARWLLRLADVEANQLGSEDRAIEALTRATEAAANDERIRVELENALRRAERFGDLRASMRLRAPNQGSEDDRIALHREVARLSEQELGDRAGAAEALREIRKIREDDAALDWLVDDARRRDDVPELIALLGARYEGKPDPTTRTATGLELAALLDRDGRDRPRARVVLEAIRGIAPNPVPVLEHLSRICREESDDAGLASTWSELLDHVTDTKTSIDLARGLHALATGPVDSEPLAAKALARWSALAPSEKAPLVALVEMHVRAGREREAADALLELGKRMDSPSEAEEKLLESSERYEAAGDLEAAMGAARLAKSLGFGSLRARERLGEVAERAGRFDVVLEVADARAADAAGQGEAGRGKLIEELLICATIAREKLANPNRASQYLLRASELAEGDPVAVERVESVAASIDRAAADAGAALERALVHRLLERASVEEGEARIARLTRAAKILASAIGDFDGAYNLLAEATVEDANPTLLAALVETAVTGAKVGELEKLLRQRFDESVDGDTARAILETQVSMYDRVNRASDAADVLQRIFSMRSTVENRDRLLEMLSRAGRHKDRVNVLEQAIRRAPADSEERNELGRRVARIWDSELANKFEALDAWKRVLRWAPNDSEAIEAVERHGVKRASLLPPAPKPPTTRSVPPAPIAAPAPKPAALAAPSTPALPPPPVPALPPPPVPALPPPVGSAPLPPLPALPQTPTTPQSTATPITGLDPRHLAASSADDVDTTPPPASDPLAIPAMPPPAVPREAAAMTLEAADADAVEEIDDTETLEDLDAVEELDVGEPEPDHVRSHVSLPPPPPPPRGR